MELAEEGVALARPALESAGGEQVHRVPEAVVLEHAEDGCRDDHGNAAGDASADSGGDVKSFHGQDSARRRAFRTARRVFDDGARAGSNVRLLGGDGDGFVGLMWEDLQEPSDGAGNAEAQPEDADDKICHHAGQDQRDAEREHQGPRGGAGKLDRGGIGIGVQIVFHRIHSSTN